MVNDASVTFTLTCTKANDEEGAFFTIPAKFIGGNCKVVAEAGGRTTTGTCFVYIVDNGEVEKSQATLHTVELLTTTETRCLA